MFAMNQSDVLNIKIKSAFKKYFPHVMVYLGFLTTGVAVPKEAFFIHRFSFVVIVALLLYFILARTILLHKNIIIAFLVLLLLSFVSVFKGNATSYLVIRTFIGLIVVQVALFSYFKYYNFSYEIIIKHYIKIALILSYIGIFQEISYLIGFVPGYDYSWFLPVLRGQPVEDIAGSGPIMRITSLCGEPGYLAPTLMPAGFLAIHNLLSGCDKYIKRAEGILILIALTLTFSTIGYIGMVISLMFNFKRNMYKKVNVVVAGLIISLLLVMSNISYFSSRAYGIWSSLIDRENLTGHENVSSLIAAVNYKITIDNISKNPIIGSGFDSFNKVSQKSLERIELDTGLRNFIGYMDIKDMRFDDGSTMYFRVITELGLIGVIFVIIFLYNNKVKNKNTDIALLQNMCILYFLTYCLRTGQYIRFELWYFIGFYYCLKKSYCMNNYKNASIM
jgi:hypothetical protein